MIKKIVLGFILTFATMGSVLFGSLLVESWTDIDLPWITETTITTVQLVETRI